MRTACQACAKSDECEAIVHANQSSGPGTCYGKRDVKTSFAEGGCDSMAPYVTEFLNGAAPWGKCTLLGDPHITTFDRNMAGSNPPAAKDEYMVPINFYQDGEYQVANCANSLALS